ncbi:hypothetical protein, partial [Barnesiella sp. An55]|uniref:hypothetical protein n=1 Tax=Barnesiella sp. An55 TaxID=1965646 RepID=UPI000B567D76
QLSAHDHSEGWIPLPASGGTIGAGSTDEQPAMYYLTGDTKLSSDLVIADGAVVTLCLNGYQLTGLGDNPVISVDASKLTVCDCQEGSEAPEHQHRYYKNEGGRFVFDDGSDEWNAQYEAADTIGVIDGGVITGGLTRGGIFVDGEGACFTLESGVIAGNRSIYNNLGGGIGIWDSSDEPGEMERTAVINGGQVAGNTSVSRGGAIFTYEALTLNGGKIWGNRADKGGGVYISGSNAHFVMNGGEISGNIGESDAGAICGNLDSQFTLNDGLIIDNVCEGFNSGGGIYILQGRSLVINGGLISGNTGGYFGAGISAIMVDTISITGGVIINNSAVDDKYTDKDIFINRQEDSRFLSVAGGYIGRFEVNQVFGHYNVVEGGFFVEPTITDYLTEGSIAIPVGEGVTGYREGFPYGVYKRNTNGTDIALDITPGNPAYDQAPIEAGIDFTVEGIPDSFSAVYAYRTDTIEPFAYGLPTDVGSYHILSTLVDNQGQWYGQTPFDITIDKGEWPGEKLATGMIAAGHSDSIALPEIPEGAYLGTPSGDTRILDAHIADGYLYYTG